ncbi:LicD family protein [Clostridium sp. M62/1]|uniref:LicD family protein n=1 Tax=Clostridium sp. M62/1 TaxID=411486 RepID=UPI0001973282|nr:LicD family protein [Clostridium sp. M62/1]EFE13018.1 LICD family protein [Clostridium sp. M62/1]UEB79732.1 LicD family protein [Clostridium sp. M62/1]
MEEREHSDLTRVHEANLKLLKEIDRICRKYRIQYMLDSGTLLGAVRHKGFIPWDDDADVVFTRPNYEKFLKVAERELPKGMTLLRPQDIRGGRVFYDFTTRILYDNSRVHEDNGQMRFYEGKLNHLWVDLFVLDRLPEGKFGAFFAKFLQKVVYGMAIGHRDQIDFSKYSLADKVRVGVLSTVGKLIPMPFLIKLQTVLAAKDWKKKTDKRYYSNYQPDYLYVTLDADWCEETVDLEFEDTVLMAPKGYDHVLTWIYGDYMKLPPKEKQVPAHSSIEIEILD